MLKVQDDGSIHSENVREPDAEFGGPEARKELERELLRKLDTRLSMLVVIYILNCAFYLIRYPKLPLRTLRY
jgi:MFS transporter, ACS family, DAL5 transporter family protein